MAKLIKLNNPFIQKVLHTLLKDKTSGKNIMWATKSYEYLGNEYKENRQITIESLNKLKSNELQPRILKSLEAQKDRTKQRAEVFTPSFICNKMNNDCDEDWFGYRDIFNFEKEKSWRTRNRKIIFPEGKDWKKYVNLVKLEITCGEGPFIVSRYDSTTGKLIKIENRIGFLDRKLRIVNENTENEEEWFKWVIKAYQNTYGYEFQGDNLLIARINLLLTFIDNLEYKWHREPTTTELKKISNIISWNIWQMDAFEGTIPFGGSWDYDEEYVQMTIFDYMEILEKKDKYENGVDCILYDWHRNKKIKFKDLK